MQHLELTLTAADGRIGKERLDEGGPMVWTGVDMGGQTTSALFELTHKGVVIDSYEIDGDDWRQLENEGRGVAAVWEGLEKGWSLQDAVDAAVVNEDPFGWDEEVWEIEQERAQIQSKLDAALTHLELLVSRFEVDQLHDDYAVWKAAADFIGYGR